MLHIKVSSFAAQIRRQANLTIALIFVGDFCRELAHKILVTGKSINFLKDICEEKTLIKGKKELKEYLETNGSYIGRKDTESSELFFCHFSR